MDSTSIVSLAIAFITTYFIGMLAILVIMIIANWKIFTKGGQPGWKVLIPVYNFYIKFKITWSATFFWISVICGIASGTLEYFAKQNGSNILLIMSSIFMIIYAIIMLIQQHKTSLAFGHGFGFTLGLIFLNPIFILILAFGKSEYQGPQ